MRMEQPSENTPFSAAQNAQDHGMSSSHHHDQQQQQSSAGAAAAAEQMDAQSAHSSSSQALPSNDAPDLGNMQTLPSSVENGTDSLAQQDHMPQNGSLSQETTKKFESAQFETKPANSGTDAANDQQPVSSELATPADHDPAQTDTQQQQQAPASVNSKPLNVQDALSYLDQVKLQFQDQPDVYNRFLDIMKDFKSQAIDTPGVIQRVSQLFRFHPGLIIGFNTFLPPGYKIEILSQAQNAQQQQQLLMIYQQQYPNMPIHPQQFQQARSYRITTPESTFHYMPAFGSEMNMIMNHQQGHTWPHLASQHPQMGMHPPSQPQQRPPQYAPASQHAPSMYPQYQQQPQHQQPQTQRMPVAHQQQQHQASVQPAAPVEPPVSNGPKQPIEFNQAISYVNKIKTRFANQPEVYRTFLEILRAYQQEGRDISEVYGAVRDLFKNDLDLLDEFQNFLPDVNNQVQPAGITAQDIQQRQMYEQQQQQQRAMKRQYQSSQVDSQAIPMKQRGGQLQHQTAYQRFESRSGMMRHPTQFAAPSAPSSIAQYSPAQEFEFFERVKKSLANRQTYSEFLKLLNLFNQDIIDVGMLVRRAEPFLGGRSSELFEWFKGYVRYDDEEGMQGQDFDITRVSTPPRELEDAKRSGSSYRLLPPDYTQPMCSGREALQYEVLNDQWICHPTWASEDGGFVAHQKNQFEEAMYRCEEERYEFDLWIDRLRIVISRLEAILVRRIQSLASEEDRKAFKLPGFHHPDDPNPSNLSFGRSSEHELYRTGLGDGMSAVMYRRVIEKIYAGERSSEVLDALHEHPAVSIPIVLKRLKQKHEEWCKQQRDWNKIWREIDGKNFYKSLDHQGIGFKSLDRKLLSGKTLVGEIENVYRERYLQRQRQISTKQPRQQPKYHLSYSLVSPTRDGDNSIIGDIIRLIMAYLEKASQVSQEDMARVKVFLEKFCSQFLQQDRAGKPATLYANNTYYLFLRLLQIAHSRLSKIQLVWLEIDKTGSGYSKLSNQQTARSLGLLSAQPVDAAGISTDTTNDSNIQNGQAAILESANANRDSGNSLDQNQSALASQQQLPNNPSTDPEALLVLDSFGGGSASSNSARLNIYKQMLNLVEKMFESPASGSSGGLEQSVYEEQARFWFGRAAFVTYTFDKLFHAICKQLMQIITDEQSVALFGLFAENNEREQQRSSATTTSIKNSMGAAYRRKADDLVDEEENLYKIEYDPKLGLLMIELLGDDEDDDDGQEKATTIAGKPASSTELSWSEYIDKYVKQDTTADPAIIGSESSDETKRRGVYLHRNKRQPKPNQILHARNQLECKICVNTYKMFFVENSEDSLWFVGGSGRVENTKPARMAAAEKFSQLIDKQVGNNEPEKLKLLNENWQRFMLNGIAGNGKNNEESFHEFSTRHENSQNHYITTTSAYNNNNNNEQT